MKTLRRILSTKMPLVQRWMPAVAFVAIILSAFTEWLPEWMPTSFLWVGVFIAYGLILYFSNQQKENDAERLNQLAEHYYFVGYIATITGLGCVLYQLGMRVQSNQNLEELLTPDLLKLGGASVFCTIIGLIGMNIFRAQAFEQEQKARKLDAEQDQKRTQDVVRQIAKNFENFENRMKELESTRMEEFSRLMDASELSKVLTQLVGEIQGGAKGLEDLRKVSKSAFGTIGHLEKKLTGMDGALQGIAEGSDKVQQNFATIADQSDRIETLASHLESASNSLKTLGEDGKSSVQELRDQFDLLSEIIKQTNEETQGWKDKTNAAHKRMDDFIENFSNLCHKLKTSANKEIGDFCAAFETACHKLNNSLQTAENFVQKLSDGTNKAANFSKSLENLTAQTAEHNKAFESFKTDLQQTATALTQNIQELLAQFKTLGEQITDASQKTQIWKNQTNETGQEMQQFGESFQTACQQLQASSETVIRYADSLQQHLNDPNWNSKMAGNFVDDLAQRINEFAKRISESLAKMPNLSQSLEETRDKTNRINTELETIIQRLKDLLKETEKQPGFFKKWLGIGK